MAIYLVQGTNSSLLLSRHDGTVSTTSGQPFQAFRPYDGPEYFLSRTDGSSTGGEETATSTPERVTFYVKVCVRVVVHFENRGYQTCVPQVRQGFRGLPRGSVYRNGDVFDNMVDGVGNISRKGEIIKSESSSTWDFPPRDLHVHIYPISPTAATPEAVVPTAVVPISSHLNARQRSTCQRGLAVAYLRIPKHYRCMFRANVFSERRARVNRNGGSPSSVCLPPRGSRWALLRKKASLRQIPHKPPRSMPLPPSGGRCLP